MQRKRNAITLRVQNLFFFEKCKIFLLVCILLGVSSNLIAQDIVYRSTKDGTWDIWGIYENGSGKINLSKISHDPFNQYWEDQPKWSPDGRRIAFRSDKSGFKNIWIMDEDGTNDYILINTDKIELDPFWSPDGSKIYFTRQTLGSGCSGCANWEIFFYDFLTDTESQLTSNNCREMEPVVSPCGDYIAYVHAEYCPDCCNQTDIWVMNSDGTNQQLLSSSLGVRNGIYEEVRDWAEDIILYQLGSWSADVAIYYPGLDIVDRVTNDGYVNYPYSLSPDGQKILFASNRNGYWGLYAVEIYGDRSNPVLLTDDPGAEYWADWKPMIPAEEIGKLIDQVSNLNLQNGIDNSLDVKLEAAIQALDDINQNNNVAAINALQAFINAVEAQSGNKILVNDADALIGAAERIIMMLS